MFFSYDFGLIAATNTRPHCGAFRPTPATDWQQVQVHLVSSQLRTANKSKCAWSQLSYGNGNKCAAVGPIRQPGGIPPLMDRLPLLHRLKRRNRRCLPLKPLHLHQHRLRRRRLRQPARPLVPGQHIGVPMLVQAVGFGGVEGVVPQKRRTLRCSWSTRVQDGSALSKFESLGWAQAYRTANFSCGR